MILITSKNQNWSRETVSSRLIFILESGINFQTVHRVVSKHK